MTEILLLRILLERSNYERYARFIGKHVLSDQGSTLFQDFGEYFKVHPDIDTINLDKFESWFTVIKHKIVKPEKLEIYQKIFERINAAEDEAAEDLIKEFVKRDSFSKIADIAMSVAEGEQDGDSDDIQRLLKEYETAIGKVNVIENLEVTTDIVELIEAQSGQEGLNWRLPELQFSIGPVQHQLIIFGSRPDSGKTTFLTSEASYMAEQLKNTDKHVIVLNNEEFGETVKHRMIQSALGITNEEMNRDPVWCLREIEKLWGVSNRVKIFDDVYDLWTATQILETQNPGLIVVDQLWNMQGFSKKQDNEVTRITGLYKEARKWGKLYRCPVLVVHQLDGSAGGMLYPNMEQFYLSKTALQGDGDAIITLGKSYDSSVSQDTRGLHIVKNKLGKHSDCIRELKHGQMEVQILPEIGRFTGEL